MASDFKQEKRVKISNKLRGILDKKSRIFEAWECAILLGAANEDQIESWVNEIRSLQKDYDTLFAEWSELCK